MPADLYPVEGGQHDIEQDQVGPELAEERHGPPAVGAVRHLEPLLAEHDAEHLGEGLVVVDHQYACVHVVNLSSGSGPA